ncbi:TPA: KAP family P-loop NTPase fold protein, partial [Aeromonas veronii]
RGEDALALAFFRELYAGLSPSLGEKVKKQLPRLGARLLRAGTLVGKVVETAVGGVAGTVAEKGMEWLSGLIEQDESVEALHTELSNALREQKKRFLIVIDDIDRLSPDEVLLMFRLVKSVGRLPNVMYLLVYDRLLAEKIVTERYPSEGAHYLEKIVQAAFELPEPSAFDVQQHLQSQIVSICGSAAETDSVRFMNIFYESIAPAMRTPRDVIRYTNSLSVSWPAVANEVNCADFLALEVFRLLHPEIYRAIRQNKSILSGNRSYDSREREEIDKRFNELFFGPNPKPGYDRIRRSLMRLFPALESVWRNHTYGGNPEKRWRMERRVCSDRHFDTYFRFSISDDALTSTELNEFLVHVDDVGYVKRTLSGAVSVVRRAGGTKAAVWLEYLHLHADCIAQDKVQPLLTALFEIADDLNVEADNAKGFGWGNNNFRLLGLLRALTLEKMSLEERSSIFLQACATASIGWLGHFTHSAWTDYYPREGKEPESPENCLTTEAVAHELRRLLYSRIKVAAADGSLCVLRNLTSLLYSWVDLANDDGAAVRAWTSTLITTDDGVRLLAKAFTSYAWTQGVDFDGMGDLVAKRVVQVNLQNVAYLTEVEVFRSRVVEVIAEGADPDIQLFLDAWLRAEQGHDD